MRPFSLAICPRRSFALSLTALLTFSLVAAQGTAISGKQLQAAWVRSPAISPDGRTVAFISRGQVRVVPITGGASQALTPAGTSASSPVWAPDGRTLAFSSNVAGDPDVYVASVDGGSMERRTFSSVGEYPTGFSPDGREVLFLSARLGDPIKSRFTAKNYHFQLYTTPVTGGRSHLLIPTIVDDARWNRQGTLLVYQNKRGLDRAERQHRLSANADELWLYNPKTQQHTPFVRDGSEARNPVWAADGQSVYYLSERSGTLNIWRKPLGSGHEEQLTHYTDEPVEGLSVSDAGDLAFTHAGQLQLLKHGQAAPQPVRVQLPEFLDNQQKTFVENSTTDFAAAPDGQHFTLMARGDIFLMDKKGHTYPVTHTPEEERYVTFSPDGQSLLYSSARRDKKGVLEWRLYKAELPKDDHALGEAGTFRETLLETGLGAAQQANFSPDGKKVAFVYERREVRVLDVASGKVTTLYKPSDYFTNYRDEDLPYRWSPDSRQLAVPWRIVGGGDDIQRWAIVPADGSAPLQPVSEQLTEQDSPHWSEDGTRLFLLTARNSMRGLNGSANSADSGLYGIFMSEEARSQFLQKNDEQPGDQQGQGKDSDKGKDKSTNDAPKYYPFSPVRKPTLEGLLVRRGVEGFLPLSDATHVLLLNWGEDKLHLRKLDLLTQETEDLDDVSFSGEVRGIDTNKDKDTLYFVAGSRVYTVPLDEPSHTSKVSFELRVQQSPVQTYRAAFDQAWLDYREKFYRPDMHGQDWNKVYQTYAAYLNDVSTLPELQQLIGEMSGTLGTSHVFRHQSRPRLDDDSATTDTGSLGVFEDDHYNGPGVRIRAVLPGGPLDRLDYDIQPGDVITAIGGQPVPDLGGIDKLLDGQVDQRISVTLRRGEDKAAKVWTVYVKPISQDEEAELDESRITQWRRAKVERLSGGKLAYVFLPGMENDDLITAYNTLLTMQDKYQGAVLDIRGNTGGNIDPQLLTLLTGKVNQLIGKEGRPWSDNREMRWHKPSALIIDSFSYSDGSVFPQLYQDAKLGPVVGEALVNTGTAVDWTASPLLPNLAYSIPVMPIRRANGSYYENNVIHPDILVPHDPNAEQAGQDLALAAAVKALLK